MKLDYNKIYIYLLKKTNEKEKPNFLVLRQHVNLKINK